MKKNGLKRPLNLWLDEDVDQLLSSEKKRTGRSRTALINETVRAAYSKGGKPPSGSN